MNIMTIIITMHLPVFVSLYGYCCRLSLLPAFWLLVFNSVLAMAVPSLICRINLYGPYTLCRIVISIINLLWIMTLSSHSCASSVNKNFWILENLKTRRKMNIDYSLRCVVSASWFSVLDSHSCTCNVRKLFFSFFVGCGKSAYPWKPIFKADICRPVLLVHVGMVTLLADPLKTTSLSGATFRLRFNSLDK